ncbi:molybdenum cofactor biosynthesis protein MoaE [Pseudomonadales bacterium]|jgi:molybdopterin synthase catalytic subunit|nr:molybdenum cofactor biosynthesis protein MoaE [Pseudomonadales bacterium]MDC1083922.1 molybdenum cofactor biosynthesis protein MoaE [Pseudomonadales bacterium]
MIKKVVVQIDDFDVNEETAFLVDISKEVGGINTFLGTVRDVNEGDTVTGLRLEHYPGMTEKQIHAIIDRASSRWSVLGAVVIHRVGDLQPGEKIVFVGIASKHRGDAFRACEYVMDSLKTEATFWKKEVTEGEARWLTTRQTDVEALNKWQVD